MNFLFLGYFTIEILRVFPIIPMHYLFLGYFYHKNIEGLSYYMHYLFLG